MCSFAVQSSGGGGGDDSRKRTRTGGKKLFWSLCLAPVLLLLFEKNRTIPIDTSDSLLKRPEKPLRLSREHTQDTRLTASLPPSLPLPWWVPRTRSSQSVNTCSSTRKGKKERKKRYRRRDPDARGTLPAQSGILSPPLYTQLMPPIKSHIK